MNSKKHFHTFEEGIQNFYENTLHYSVFSKYLIVQDCPQLSSIYGNFQKLALILDLKKTVRCIYFFVQSQTYHEKDGTYRISWNSGD